jgi:predicted GNAT family acetyltransferase
MGGGRSAGGGRNAAARNGGGGGGGDTKQIPMGKLPSELQGAGRAQVLTDAMDGQGTVETVDPRQLKNTQADLGVNYVPSRQEMPVVARVDGKLYVVDGHHRKYRAIEQGKDLKVRVIERGGRTELGSVSVNGRSRDLAGKTTIKQSKDGGKSVEIAVNAGGSKTSAFVQFKVSKDGKAKISYIESSKSLKGQKVGERLYGAAIATAKRMGATTFTSDFRLSTSAVKAWGDIKSKLGSAVTKAKGATTSAGETTSFNTGKPLFSVNLKKVSQKQLSELGKK